MVQIIDVDIIKITEKNNRIELGLIQFQRFCRRFDVLVNFLCLFYLLFHSLQVFLTDFNWCFFLSLKFKWQQVISGLQDFSEFSNWSQ